MNYEKENNILGKNIIDNIFIKNWHYTNKDKGAFGHFELDIIFRCDLACKYCYVNKYGDSLYPKELRNNETILKNTEAIINWLISNELNPTLEIFSGEPFSQKIGFLVLEKIYELYKKAPEHVRPRDIVIPTNFTFILSDKLIKKVDDLRDKFNSLGIFMALSASVEGKYMEQNRPFKNKSRATIRDDAYYDKLFEYCSKNHYGFHPMVYSDNIEKWIDNFLWFQEMFKKHNIQPFQLYLLEVRNAEWTIEQIKQFTKFYDFLIKWTFDFFKGDKRTFVRAIVSSHCGFNIISSPILTIGRGLGCSIQSTIYVRLGDLKVFPCHRLFRSQFETMHFIKDDECNIRDIEVNNPELLLAIYSFQSTIAPYCSSCINKYMCSKGCLGSQFETTGDIFTPIPTVCQLEFAKSIQFVKSMNELCVLSLIKQHVSEQVLQNINLIENLYKNGGNN